MIRYLQDQEKQDCRALWEEAFPEDSAEFCDYYFQEKMKDNRVLVREESGIIQSMLHLNPYRLYVNGYHWMVDYIVGVATRADCRRRGYMRELLVKMFGELNEEEMPFVFLMPAAEEIYLPYDFVYIFDQPLWQLKESDKLASQTLFPVAERGSGQPIPLRSFWQEGGGQKEGFGWQKRVTELAGWMNRWLKQHYQVYALRDEQYLDRLEKELLSEDGRMEVLYDGGRMVGVVAEWGRKEPDQRFLYSEPGYYDNLGYKPAIMARIVNIRSFVKVIHLRKHYRLDEVQIMLRIHDPLISENDGFWRWNLTREMSWIEKVGEPEMIAAELFAPAGRDQTGNPGLLELTIAEMTEWLFGYSVPKAAIPYDMMIQSLHGVFLDEVV